MTIKTHRKHKIASSTTKTKKQLTKDCGAKFKAKVIELAGGKCEVCGNTQHLTAHHYNPRSLAGHMIYWLPNGICLCMGCHFAHHTRSDPRIHDIIKIKRGQEWLKLLEEKRTEKHKSSFKTLLWLEEQLKCLT
jgi:5-methylcytosine-specific restriction endonuclease McrA